jgi:alcohol dehydrogenase class IV
MEACMLKTILFQTTPRILMGPGALSQTAAEVQRLKSRSVLIVTDKGVIAAGLAARLEAVLTAGDIPWARFDAVEPDPRFEIAVQAAETARRTNADLVIGLGGGSPLDIAKVCAVLATNSKPVAELFGIDMVPNAGLMTILIPTTAGTGSEVTPIAILSDEQEKLKKGIVSPRLFPAAAILDPELTLGMPPAITAATGLDALIHAVEAFTSRNANSISDVLARQAMKLIFENLRKAYANGEDLAARANMLEGSLLAGMAFANAGVTAVHAFAYPIGAEFHIPHGVANSIMLPPVMEFNMLGNLEKFAEMAEIFGEPVQGLSLRERARRMVKAIRELVDDLQVPKHLREFGVREQHLPDLARGVMKVTRLLANNPRRITAADAEAIYREVL